MRLIAATCVMGMLAACARSDDPSEPTAAASTAPPAAVERAGHGRLRSDIDTSALQRLLAAVPYSSRELVRTSFELVPGEMRDLSFRDRAQDELAAAVYKQSDGRTQGQSQRSADAERRLNLWSRPVLLALATDTKLVPKDGVLVLRSGKWDYDAVLLGQDAANTEGLDAALRAVYTIRVHDGLRPRSNRIGKLQLRSSFFSQGRQDSNKLPRSWSTYLEAKLGAAQDAGIRVVPGLGPFKAVDFVVVNR